MRCKACGAVRYVNVAGSLCPMCFSIARIQSAPQLGLRIVYEEYRGSFVLVYGGERVYRMAIDEFTHLRLSS